MKTRTALSMLTCVLATTACACSAEPTSDPAANETTGTAEQKQVVGASGNVMIWPAGPIAWEGLTGTWPISVWSTAPIGALAFDMAGATDLSVSCLGCEAGLVSSPITTAWLDAFVPPASANTFGAPLLGSNGLFAPAFGFQGSFTPSTGIQGSGFRASAPGVGVSQGSFTGGVAGSLTSLLTPALSRSALMFSDLAAPDLFTQRTFNVRFTVQNRAAQQSFTASSTRSSTTFNAASVSVFASSTRSSELAAMRAVAFTSMAFVALPPLRLGATLGDVAGRKDKGPSP
jgi:hypothetical protein